MGRVIQDKKNNKTVAIIICLCVILLTISNTFNNHKNIVEASSIFEAESTEGVYYGVQSYGNSSNASFYFNCGDKYIGSWLQGKFSGIGEYTYLGIGTYTGAFVSGIREGIGNFEWLDKSFYTGEWKNDKIHGKGVFISKAGYLLEGNFWENKFIQGTLTYRKLEGTYVFEIENGKYSENVKIEYKNGTTYSGKYTDKDITYGTLTYENGDKYIGAFEKGLKSGSGIYRWNSGAYCVGNWSNDKMNGLGTYYYDVDSKGDFLEGTFENNKPNGTCLYMDKEGNAYSTIWSNGKCIKVERSN